MLTQLRHWLIRQLGGCTQDELQQSWDGGVKHAKAFGLTRAYERCLDAMNRAYDTETKAMDMRYHGVAKKAIDGYEITLRAELRREFGVEREPMGNRVSIVSSPIKNPFADQLSRVLGFDAQSPTLQANWERNAHLILPPVEPVPSGYFDVTRDGAIQ